MKAARDGPLSQSRRRWRGRLAYGIRLVAALAVAAGLVAVSPAQNPRAATSPSPTGDKRVALVIGIGAYKAAARLANPPNDARRMAETLRNLNFEVDERIDPDFQTLSHALRAFGIRAQNADAALIFYAGHGVQVDRENWLVPSDAQLEREHDLPYEALPLELFLDEVSQAQKVGIILLDACRNNPFNDRISRSLTVAGRGRPASQGLARIDRVPRNTIVVMSTRADEIAEDGSGDDSPFTQAILAYLRIPGLELSLFFRSVRDAVLKATNNRQEPYVFSSLGAEPFYLHPIPPNRPPEIGAIATLTVADRAGPTALGLPRPTDPDNDPLTVQITGLPRAGEIRSGTRPLARDETLSLETFMGVTYAPDGKTTGAMGSLDFVVDDGRGGRTKGSLPIMVMATNRPPVVAAQHPVRVYPGALGIVEPTDPDNDPLTVTITALPSRGSVRRGDGAMLKVGDTIAPADLPKLAYLPEGAPGEVGSIRYLVDDGHGGKVEGKVDIAIAAAEDSQDLVSTAQLWRKIRDASDRQLVDAFLTLFPDSPPANDARKQLLAMVERNAAATAAAGSGTAAAPRQPTPPPPQAAPSPSPPAPIAAAARPVDLPAPAEPDHGDRGHGFQDCSDCPVMTIVPGGSFLMGVANGDPSAAPAHRVTLRAFAIGRYPVTVAEWRACVSERGCVSMPRMVDPGDRTPIHNLSWDDTQEYVAWLARKTGKKYRLPSEAEWEYAARAMTETRYWWGNEVGTGLADCGDCGGPHDRMKPLPVDSFKANPFDLYAMSGGVAQWVADCWFPDYRGAPSDGIARDRKGCQAHVLRGGSFRSDRNNIGTGVRNYYDASVRYPDHGFRVALGLE